VTDDERIAALRANGHDARLLTDGRIVVFLEGSAEEQALLTTAFQIMATRKLPGAAEA
jgi:hypothetical protein